MNPKIGLVKENGKYYLLCGNKRVAVRFEALGDKQDEKNKRRFDKQPES